MTHATELDAKVVPVAVAAVESARERLGLRIQSQLAAMTPEQKRRIVAAFERAHHVQYRVGGGLR